MRPKRSLMLGCDHEYRAISARPLRVPERVITQEFAVWSERLQLFRSPKPRAATSGQHQEGPPGWAH